MPVLDWLRSAGGRLGLVRFVSTDAPAQAPHKIPTRVVTLKELATEVRHEEVRTLAELPAEIARPFEEVYAAAGIETPPHGWTIARLIAMLRSDVCKGLSREALQRAVLQALTSDRAHVQDLVKDAVARDRALDAFEVFVKLKMQRLVAERQARIAALRQEIAALEKKIESDDSCWRGWHERKAVAEKDMAWALSHLVDEPAVTVDDKPAGKL